MGRKGLLDTAVPRLKQYMEERGEPVTANEVAEFLRVSSTSAYGILIYMEAMGKIQQAKSGRTKLYFMKGAFDEEQLAAKLSRPRTKHKPKRRNITPPSERLMNSMSEKEPVVEHNPSAPKGMLPALAILGLYQTEMEEPQPQPVEKQPTEERPEEPPMKRAGTPLFITVRTHGRVKSLPKEVRLLSKSHMTYLKEQYLKGLDGYDGIKRFNCLFAEVSALERGEYGNIFYASMGTNPWTKVYKVTVERSPEVGEN